MALPRQIDQAAGQAAKRLGAEAANEAKMMANKAAALKSDIVKEASSFSLAGTLGSVWGKASNLLFLAPMIGGVVGWAGKIKPLAPIAGKAKTVIDLHSVPVGKFSEELGKVTGKVASAEKPAGRLLHYAQNTTLGKTKLGSTALASIKEQSVSGVLMNVGFAVQETASVALSVRDKVRTLKQMQKDLTGKDVSALSIMTGGASLHPLVAQARKETTGGKSITSTGLQLAGIVGNIYLAFFDKSSGFKGMAKAMGIGMGTGMAANMLASGNTALQSYRDMTLSMAQTGKADVSLYEGLIGGLSQKAPGEMVRQIAEKAYVKQLAPAEVLKMMAETDFMKNPKSRSFVATETVRRNASKGGAALVGA